jgi:hyaluronoglucosaminidase
MQADAVGKRPRTARVSDTPVKAGVIEGFFGKPWDCPARLSSADFLRDCGYQFYIYAPKADPFLRRRWREPLPAETLQHLDEASVSRSRGRLMGAAGRPGGRSRNQSDESAASVTHDSLFSIDTVGRSPTLMRKRSSPGCAVTMCSIRSA